jgi:hypothetical protein
MEEVMDDYNADLDGVLVNVPIKVAKSKKNLKFLNKNTALRKKKQNSYSNERYIMELQRTA